jgi:outer membrane receptor protein involved in Fe transport
MRTLSLFLAAMLIASPSFAATVSGVVTDATGAVVPGARVVLRDVATGRETAVQSGPDGRYKFDTPDAGTYLLIVTRAGFSEAARTVVVDRADQAIDAPMRLEIGNVKTDVNVTAARSERETRQIPLHVETVAGEAVARSNALSTGDALTNVVNITPVGNGPFGVRPRLRGLDSTRLLVLVDGERLNTARQATDRTGAEVSLLAPDTIDRLEVVNGAGTVMYGSDALAGTINLITGDLAFSSAPRWLYGGNLLYSTNEDGRRGSLLAGVSTPRFVVRVQGGAEHFDAYRSGAFDVEDTNPLFASGALDRRDTIDDNFGFSFNAFPEPFNAPYVRTDRRVVNSQAEGLFVNATALALLAPGHTLQARYQRTRMENIGFPDFENPYFFNATSLPFSNLDRFSARYEAQALRPWLARVSVSGYFQRTERLLKNLLPVQFPAPTPQVFFPIAVMRLDIASETEQNVSTPGFDLQANIVPATNHLLTAGLTFYRDRSHDERTAVTTTSMVGQVVMGQRGPAPVVFPSPIQLGPPTTSQPVRVPDASLQDVGLFLQDEWRVLPKMSIVAGLRGDFYTVKSEATPGYDIDSVVGGANPPIDPATLPDPAGARYARQALTGDVGVVANAGGGVSPFGRVGRSYRHPNLEEMLFAGPATIGSIAPNVLVRPEVGTNVDAGANFRAGRVSGAAFVFVNQYRDFIAQDLVVATTPTGPLAQATNYADVRISGVELSATAPIVWQHGVLTLTGAGAFTRGTITQGVDPLTGESLDGTPADNITPSRVIASARFTEPGGRWWVEYGVRSQADVTRVAETLLTSPFVIAQDLLSLDGFTVHRIGGGFQLSPRANRVRLTFAVENLSNTFYREHFQFAPARGRSVTIGLHFGSF